ncbi:ABC transporter ATP-binding protein [Megalodesulfovibrio gigas]|uniref:Putative ABC transporter family protein n=1 Tax=Megalodesulfovibrio gigas (strain ATCC 19364 / DSM 1382 / NCIMB 9332 / VKM B-1759) TaxID=1121448 RepID=T2GBH1_MEGG1|nr:ABC transporter ATP-binding protein [Megalodesulfovibrio gigas]AGW13623.1 putative ABC transporter family protein [Megalodesulfovibrio gigas DSM 1382 = ATCC 19364]
MAGHIRIEGISKSFGMQQANRNVSLDIRAGRILALLGENGAGKSTLMSILAGTLTPDTGQILVDGLALPPGTPAASLAAGIGMVHQHFLLMEQLRVAQNVCLGLPGAFWLSPRRMATLVRDVGRRFGLEIDPTARVGALSMGERQRVEILKLLARDCSVLIFDEPTAVLTPGEASILADALCGMVAQGKAVVFISHKLPEIMALAARAPVDVAVLRQGEVVARYDLTQDTPSESELIRAMVGREVDLAQVAHLAAAAHPLGDEVLCCRGLQAPGLQGVSLTVRQGEIVALAGVAGNGQKPLVEVLAGVCPPEGGEVRLLDHSWQDFYSGEEPGRGLAVIPEDRRGAATAGNLDLLDNYLLTTRRRYTRGMLIDRRQALQDVRQLIEDFNVRPPEPATPGGRLSGGNLQKLVLGREFSRDPRLVVAEQPAQGLDVGATEDVWRRLLAMRARAGVLLVTSDLTEALLLADRILVLYAGRIMGEVRRGQDSEDARARIGRWMAGLA